MAGTYTNFFRTVCLWTLAFVQTFNFYGLMLNSPVVFRKKQYGADGVEDTSKVVFDYVAILVVNSGDVIGNVSALLALVMKINPRWVAGVCAAVSVPLLWVPLVPELQATRFGLVFMMLIGRIPAAPIGAMSWILNAMAYPTLFRATGHGWANAVARFGAITASSMYSMSAAVSIPIHALALALAVPAALLMPWGSLAGYESIHPVVHPVVHPIVHPIHPVHPIQSSASTRPFQASQPPPKSLNRNDVDIHTTCLHAARVYIHNGST